MNTVMGTYQASRATSSYWHCPSEGLFVFHDHDVLLYNRSCLMVRSLHSLNFLSGSQTSNVPLTGSLVGESGEEWL